MSQHPREEARRTPEELTYALVDRVLAISAATFGAVNQALQELELTEALANLLWHIDPAGEPLTMGKLAGKLYCDPSTVTFLIGKLERAGLVERKPGHRDKRSRTVHLTADGSRARARLVEIITHQTPLANLSLRERMQLLRLASKALPLPASPVPPTCFGEGPSGASPAPTPR
ncbi:MarR family winged helix-turn-helix transcriptional regulator [Streptomyces sp. OE57]|uniref:MarR family winged helix-turn-helix transcriptional regulator n=1 Tax=Streptomyces lacaronensis TaxID=3379885 RepID=UPI0039B77A34